MLYSVNLDGLSLFDLGIQVSKPISIMCDNMSAIQLSKNIVAIKLHFLRDKVQNNEFKLVYVLLKDRWLIFLQRHYQENYLNS